MDARPILPILKLAAARWRERLRTDKARNRLKKGALGFAGFLILWLLFGWLALPGIVQSQAEKYVAEKTGCRLSLDRPSFNPFTLTLGLGRLRLEDPAGKPLLAFRALSVNVSGSSLIRRTFVFDDLRLEAPEVAVTLKADGSLNWTPFIEALKDKDEDPDKPLPRVDIDHLNIVGGQVEFADEASGFSGRVEPLDLELTDISTLPDDQGRYRLSARTSFGARLSWQGTAELNPVALAGSIAVEDLDLANLAPYFKGLPASPGGIASLTTDYRAGYADGKPVLVAEKLGVEIKDLQLRAPGKGATLRLGKLTLAEGRVDLAQRRVEAGRLALTGGRIEARRNAQGRIDLLDMIPAKGPATSRAAPATPWHFSLDKVEVAGFSAAWRDETVKPAATFAVDDIEISAEGASDDLKQPLPLRAAFRAAGGGSFSAEGKLIPADGAADLDFKLADLSLKPVQPYLAAHALLSVADGTLSVEGHAAYGKDGAKFQGGFALKNLRLNEATGGAPFLALNGLSSRKLTATDTRLDVEELLMDGLDTSLLIAKDKTVNLSRILPPQAKTPAPAASPVKTASYLVNLDRLRIRNSELEFADQSLALPFGTRIHHLRGSINGLSSRPGAPGQLELDGQVDDYGLARAVGQIDLFHPDDFTDLKVVFRNVEMTRLTPYTATFAGRKIDSGKLSLDLEYKIAKRQLEGQNQILIDQLVLGERVESPTAKDLPLDLAIALLQDSDGRIDLGVPVSGSLDDPQFSYGSIVWKAILNIFGKIATAPFRALGSLFGGNQKFDGIAFDPGAGRLTPPEQEKVQRVAKALGKRPGLAMTIHGVWSEADRAALQDRQLRRTVAEKAGQQLEEKQDPGPLSTRNPKIQAALESLYKDRFGGGELAAMKAGFRAANPGQLEEGAAGKMMSRLTSLFREQRTLGDDEVAGMKGADFHALLFERLREKEVVTDERLQTLAKTRGDNLFAALKEAGAPMERLALGAGEKVEAGEHDVPAKLDLGTAAKGATPAQPATAN